MTTGRQATVIVPDDQLSLAIGKDGLNARLAARLTGWRVDIRSETEFANEEADMGYEEEETTGRCAAILSNGKRCPNAALPASRYCGLPAHQALAEQEGDEVAAAGWPRKAHRVSGRRCVECGRSFPKGELRRFVRGPDGQVHADPQGSAQARGAQPLRR